VKHDYLFFSYKIPHEPLDTPTFRRIVKEVLSEAGIDASAGSTRSVAASAALAEGASMNDVLLLGDWSSARTVLRHYSSL